MAVKIGKREQIVLLVISGIATIGGLHFVFFSPKTRDYNDAYNRYKTSEASVEGLKVLRNPGKLKELEDMTKLVTAHYNDAMTTLGLRMDPAFKFNTIASFQFQPPAGTPPDKVEALKKAAYDEQKAANIEKQIDLVVEELKKLMEFEADAPGGTRGMATFLGGPAGWMLPTSLPNNLSGGQLQDVVCDIKDQYEILQKIPLEQAALRQQQRASFERRLNDVGINYTLFRDARYLASFGVYVPLIHKLAYAILIQENLGEGIDCGGAPITRRDLLKWLEIHIPLAPFKDETGRELTINEMYFLHETLRFLNDVLRIAKEQNVAEIQRIELEEIGYVAAVSLNGLPPFAEDTPPPTPTPTPVPNPYTLPPEEVGLAVQGSEETGPTTMPPTVQQSGLSVSLPGPLDIGYSIPIRIIFRSNNLNAWNFIYEVLRTHFTSELDRYSIMSVPAQDQSQSVDLWFDIRLLHIPYFFALGSRPEPPAAPAPPPPVP